MNLMESEWFRKLNLPLKVIIHLLSRLPFFLLGWLIGEWLF